MQWVGIWRRFVERTRGLRAVLFVSVILGAGAGIPARADGPPTIEQVREQLAESLARIGNYRIRGVGVRKELRFVTADLAEVWDYEWSFALTNDGEKYREEIRQNLPGVEQLSIHTLSASDGKRCESLTFNPRSENPERPIDLSWCFKQSDVQPERSSPVAIALGLHFLNDDRAGRGIRLPGFVERESARVVGMLEAEDGPWVHVVVDGDPLGHRTPHVDLWFDPNRGGMLRKFERWSEGESSPSPRGEFTRYEEFSTPAGTVWFPMEGRHGGLIGDGWDGHWKLTSVELNTGFPPSEFRLEAPPGLRVIDTNKPDWMLMAGPAPAAGSAPAQATASRPPDAGAALQARPPESTAGSWSLRIGGLLLLVSAWLVHRR